MCMFDIDFHQICYSLCRLVATAPACRYCETLPLVRRSSACTARTSSGELHYTEVNDKSKFDFQNGINLINVLNSQWGQLSLRVRHVREEEARGVRQPQDWLPGKAGRDCRYRCFKELNMLSGNDNAAMPSKQVSMWNAKKHLKKPVAAPICINRVMKLQIHCTYNFSLASPRCKH